MALWYVSLHIREALTYVDANPDIFDGAMITLAMFTLNVIHPGWFLVPEEIPEPAEYKITSRPGSPSTETMLEYRQEYQYNAPVHV